MDYVAKWNQETWTVLGQGFDKVNILALAVSATGKLYVSGELPLKPAGNNSYIARWDSEKWKEINTSTIDTSLHLVLDKSGCLYAGGQSNLLSSFIVYWDGTDWITITYQLEGEAPAVLDMVVDGSGHLYIGGSFDEVGGIPAWNIAYWDGNSCHALGAGVNERVRALAVDPNGDLYAVGYFTEAGGVPAVHAARWNGKTWYPLGP